MPASTSLTGHLLLNDTGIPCNVELLDGSFMILYSIWQKLGIVVDFIVVIDAIVVFAVVLLIFSGKFKFSCSSNIETKIINDIATIRNARNPDFKPKSKFKNPMF